MALDELDLLWIPVETQLAAERTALRRAAGTEQGGDRREARRRADQDLAAQLRHPAAAARRPTIRGIRRTIRATRALAPAEIPATEALKQTVDRFLPYWNGTIAPAIRCRQPRADHRARQQPARAREVSRPHLRPGHRRAQHPDGDSAGLRARREPRADSGTTTWAMRTLRRARRTAVARKQANDPLATLLDFFFGRLRRRRCAAT